MNYSPKKDAARKVARLDNYLSSYIYSFDYGLMCAHAKALPVNYITSEFVCYVIKRHYLEDATVLNTLLARKTFDQDALHSFYQCAIEHRNLAAVLYLIPHVDVNEPMNLDWFVFAIKNGYFNIVYALINHVHMHKIYFDVIRCMWSAYNPRMTALLVSYLK